MSKILLMPDGAWLVAKMLDSCGSSSCEWFMAELFSVEKPVPLDGFQVKEEKGWVKPVFGNLKSYAAEEGIEKLDVEAVACYFGGKYHISHMAAKANLSNISRELGLEAGLVLDVLLPLDGETYRNGNHELVIKGSLEAGKLGGNVRCHHRGLIVTLPLTETSVARILSEQQESDEFMRALGRLKSPISLPKNHLRARWEK